MRKKQNSGLALGLVLIFVGLVLIVFVLTSPSAQNESDRDDQIQENNTAEIQDDPEILENAPILPNQTESSEQQNEQTEQPIVQEEPENVASEEKMTVDTTLWNLILVNPDNFLPEDHSFEKEQVQGNYYLDSRAAPFAKQMIADAKEEGIELQICSSIRDVELQTRLFNNKINDLIAEGYSEEDAKIKAATIVAVPGTSEHHTGLALDIVTPSYQRLNAGYENTDAAKWLKENAAKYGFILRYPKDKTDITKIIFEPWHYRYVGREYAEFIMSEGICFEEFIELYGAKE
ncbi:MAG: D-alanyl-D-alanine carboxypeptidase family protein [Ruminococcaceae bacterium]|nr:D-alanyl-D-alanine carboxypeptidase family protein [Oscillospiraceae bacterium]